MKWWRILLAFTWELPQTVLVLILLLFTKKYQKERYKSSVIFWRNKVRWGVSLGKFILLGKIYESFSPEFAMITIKHEYGHSIQSLIFGPFYLIVIGLPSIFFNILTRLKILPGKTYYERYPENWADKLGGSFR